jgi:hypothetical protein
VSPENPVNLDSKVRKVREVIPVNVVNLDQWVKEANRVRKASVARPVPPEKEGSLENVVSLVKMAALANKARKVKLGQ